MRTLLYISVLLLPAVCRADTFILKDGVRLEGEVTGEMDGALLVKTKYGSLTISTTDIQERKTPVPAPAAPPQASSAAAVAAASTAPAAEFPPLPAEEPAPRLTFVTVAASTSSRQLVYYEDGVAIATETFDAAGAQAGMDGAVKDGTYTEYYSDGSLKAVKSMLGGKASGTLKAFYPGAVLQVEAYYMGGIKEGPFRYFTPEGRLLLEAEYRGDKLNGWKKEYGPDGAVKTQTYYQDDRPAEPPRPQAAPAAPQAEHDTMVIAKLVILARGERISFQLNGKYLGKIQLDRDFNIIDYDGKVPNGAVKVYSSGGKFSRSFGTKASGAEAFDWNGKLAREFIFENNEVKFLRIFSHDGTLEKEFTFKDGKAIKK